MALGLSSDAQPYDAIQGVGPFSVRPLKEHPYLKGIFDGLTTTS